MNDPVMQKSSSPDGVSSTFLRGASETASPTAHKPQGSLVAYTIVALGLALFIRFFIAAPYIVSGASMEPTFDNYHYLIIDRVSYDLGNPERGDVVVFDLPGESGRALIKRIIGLPGETIMLRDSSITIVNSEHPEGFVLAEPYLDESNVGGVSDLGLTLSPDQYFVLGDNRKVSADSRIWGPLPREDIVGRVFLRLYPFTQIGFFPGKANYNSP